jgi:hypothetical protein
LTTVGIHQRDRRHGRSFTDLDFPGALGEQRAAQGWML